MERICANDEHFLIIVNGHYALQKRVHCHNGGVQACYLAILVLPLSSSNASNQQGRHLLSCDNGRVLQWRNYQEKQLTCWQGCASTCRYQSYEAVYCQKSLLASLLDGWNKEFLTTSARLADSSSLFWCTLWLKILLFTLLKYGVCNEASSPGHSQFFNVTHRKMGGPGTRAHVRDATTV